MTEDEIMADARIDAVEILHFLRVHGQGQHKFENIRLGMTGRLDAIQAAVLFGETYPIP